MGENETYRVPSPGIVEILASGSWKHALFTTYALSLSYFESEILPPLMRAGCSDIWVVADAEGYRASLLERRSARVGQEYRLIPAALPHGVFHAKCIYLSGEDDLLLIGSGNLTFHGHGKNAEVFEALRPDGAASAFSDFAEFLELIGAREDIRLARHEWTEEFAARARSAAARGTGAPDGRRLRLVHSLVEPIVQQLPRLLKPYGVCTDALVMSPYYDLDGAAIAELLQTINAPRGSAIVTTTRDESPFPFATAATWTQPVTPVRLAEAEKRFVHAKWYEFAMQERRILLTGSINATRKALLTTDNVEAGILRPLDGEGGGLACVDALMPAFAAQKPLPSGLGSNELVYAAFDRTYAHRLHGEIITLQQPAGTWRMRLMLPDGESLVDEVEVAESGRFTAQAPELEAFSQRPSLQIVMTHDAREARGWVQNEMLLGMGRHRRRTAGALSRLMRRDATDDDVHALLDYLSIHAEQHLRLFSLPIAASTVEGDGAAKGEKVVTVHIDELAPIAELGVAGHVPRGGGSADDQFHTAMARLRCVLLGHGSERSKALESARSTAIAGDDPETQDSSTPEQVAYAIGLRDFEDAIEKMIAEAADRPAVRDGLLVLLLEVSMAMRIHRLDDKDSAHEFLSAWTFKACRLSHLDRDKQTALQQHVITATAILLALDRAAGAKATLAMDLHDGLERFYGGLVDRNHALRALIDEPQAGFAGAIVGSLGEIDLRGVLDAILSTRTRRQQLDDALTRAFERQAVPDEWGVFCSGVGKRLWQAFSDPHPEKRVKRAPAGFEGCAFDHFAFGPQEEAVFKRERIGYCIHCKRFTVNTAP